MDVVGWKLKSFRLSQGFFNRPTGKFKPPVRLQHKHQVPTMTALKHLPPRAPQRAVGRFSGSQYGRHTIPHHGG